MPFVPWATALRQLANPVGEPVTQGSLPDLRAKDSEYSDLRCQARVSVWHAKVGVPEGCTPGSQSGSAEPTCTDVKPPQATHGDWYCS